MCDTHFFEYFVLFVKDLLSFILERKKECTSDRGRGREIPKRSPCWADTGLDITTLMSDVMT